MAPSNRCARPESIGRPLGSKAFLARLERLTKRTLQLGKRGPKPRLPDDKQGQLI